MYFSGGIDVDDEIGQVSRDTSSLQDITSPEITKVHEGGIEVQNEIVKVSRDTSSLKDITSSEITEEYMMYHLILGRFHLVPQFHLRILQ
jgi:hypothetical protein